MRRPIRIFLTGLSLGAFHLACSADPAAAARRLAADASYVDLATLPGVAVDLRYATTGNFTGVDLYGPFRRAFLHRVAADQLRVAAEQLRQQRPGYQLLVLDAARPRSVQQMLWAHVRGTPMQRYVANPRTGSVHNFGFAVDLTVADADGRELDMGTAFDTFDELSQPVQEPRFVSEGRLTPAQLANRRLLRAVMQAAGFVQLPLEWWHYDALPGSVVRERYSIIE